MFNEMLKKMTGEDPKDYCPLCGRKVGKGNYGKKGCSECAIYEDD